MMMKNTTKTSFLVVLAGIIVTLFVSFVAVTSTKIESSSSYGPNTTPTHSNSVDGSFHQQNQRQRRRKLLPLDIDCVLYLKVIDIDNSNSNDKGNGNNNGNDNGNTGNANANANANADDDDIEEWNCEFTPDQTRILVDLGIMNGNGNNGNNNRNNNKQYYYSSMIIPIYGVSNTVLEAKGAVSGESVMKMRNQPTTSASSSAASVASPSAVISSSLASLYSDDAGVGKDIISSSSSFAIIEAEADETEEGRAYYDPDNEEPMQLYVPDNGDNIMIETLIPRKRHQNPQLSSLQQQQQPQRGRRRSEQDDGRQVMKTLVVRVTDSHGVRMVTNTTQLLDAVFGKNDNDDDDDAKNTDVSFRSQYSACSKNQFLIEKATATTTMDSDSSNANVVTTSTTATSRHHRIGLVDVVIDIPAEGNSRSKIGTAAVEKAEELYGNGRQNLPPQQLQSLQSQFDLVLFCLPKGSSSSGGQKNWIAYAYINRWSSFYNNIGDSDDHWCQRSSTLMHETGHNLNLAHSGIKNDPYGDQSSLMGYSYNEDETRMCFNAAKNYQLDWYQKQSINPLNFIGNPRPHTVNLVSIDGYNNNEKGDEFVTFRLENNQELNYYIGFNGATGVNLETKEAQNMVVIFEKITTGDNDIDGYGKSNRIASLKEGEMYKISNYNNTIYTVLIDVLDIRDDNMGATITISAEEPSPTEAPTLSCGGNPNDVGRFKLEFGIDNFGKETTWKLCEEQSGAIVAEETNADTYTSNSFFVEPQSGGSYCLQAGYCYEFKIKDGFGDGLCCEYGAGYYRGILDGINIFEGGEFEKEDRQRFCVSTPTNVPSDVPSIVPTISPTTSPTKAPSTEPTTKRPTSPPTNKKCPSDTKRVIYKLPRNGSKKKCNWVQNGKTLKIRRNRCNQKKKNVKVKHKCPNVCGKHAGVGRCKFLYTNGNTNTIIMK